MPGAQNETGQVHGILTKDMQRVVEAELGFIATVCPDGTPNLSPKGTTAVWDHDHLVFADLRSPGTVENLRSNASIEINAVDQLVRKGYRGRVYRGRRLRAWRAVLRGPRTVKARERIRCSPASRRYAWSRCPPRLSPSSRGEAPAGP
jgi:predicted pyridoxine 5'-phosphate oxidase superfamily flavin-nucleotide-binding protein